MPTLRPDITVVTANTWEPVTLEEARLWTRADPDDTSQDAMLLELIQAARERAEDLTGMSLVRQTLRWSIDKFPASDLPLEIPWPPLISVTSITYMDSSGDWQALAGSPDQWILNTAAMPAKITPLYGESWPDVRDRSGNVQIEFVCGYAAAAQVPARAKLWMRKKITDWDCDRETISPKAYVQLPRGDVDGLLDTLRFSAFFA